MTLPGWLPFGHVSEIPATGLNELLKDGGAAAAPGQVQECSTVESWHVEVSRRSIANDRYIAAYCAHRKANG